MWDYCETPAFHLLFCIDPFGSPMKVTIYTPSPCLVILLLLLLGFKQTGWDVMRTYGNMEKHVEFEKLLSGIQWHIVGISLGSPVASDYDVRYVAVPFSGSVLIGSLQLKNLSIVSMHLGPRGMSDNPTIFHLKCCFHQKTRLFYKCKFI